MPQLDPTSFGNQPDHVYVARYLPHSLLLPVCSLVVFHGGAGIVLGAMGLGLPQLILPQGADQFVNAEAAVRASAALVHGPADVTAANVEASARRLLSDPRFSTAARDLSDEIRAMPHPDQVIAALTGESEGR